MTKKPLVSSLSMAFKKKTAMISDIDEVKNEHRKNLKHLVDKYMTDVQSGKAEGIRSARELVEIIKTDMLLLGEATERNEELSHIDQVRISKISSVLDENNPEVKAVLESLYQTMNQVNDEADFVPSRGQTEILEEDTLEIENEADVLKALGQIDMLSMMEEMNNANDDIPTQG